jgi:hypothetical protein
MSEDITFTIEEAEAAFMQWQLFGTLPQNWTKGTLACAIIALEKQQEETP